MKLFITQITWLSKIKQKEIYEQTNDAMLYVSTKLLYQVKKKKYISVYLQALL